MEKAGSNYLLAQKAAIAATRHRSPLLVDFKAAKHQVRAALLSAALHTAVVWTSLGHGFCAVLEHSVLYQQQCEQCQRLRAPGQVIPKQGEGYENKCSL